MNDKKLFSEQSVTTYKLQKDLGYNNQYLYQYANGTVSIRKMPIGVLRDISKYFGIPMQKMYKMMCDYLEEDK